MPTTLRGYAQTAIGLVLICVIAACSNNDEPLVIGFSAPFEGPYSDLGVQGRNGAQLAIEHLNQKGGIHGRKLRLLGADDSGAVQGPIEADASLIEKGAVAIIGHMTSGQTVAALPHLQKREVVLLSPTTSTPELSGKEDNFFRVMSANTAWAQALAEFTVASLHCTTVGIVVDSDNREYANPYVNAFTETLRAAGGRVIDRTDFSAKEGIDPQTLIARFAAQPEALLIVASARDSVGIIQAVRKMDRQPTILLAPWAYTKRLVELGGTAVNGIITAMDYSDENDHPRFHSFQKEYFARFGATPSFSAAFSYDAVLALARGLEITGGSAKGLAKALAGVTEIEGVSGVFGFDKYGDVNRPYYLLTVVDGRLATLEKP